MLNLYNLPLLGQLFYQNIYPVELMKYNTLSLEDEQGLKLKQLYLTGRF